MRTNSILTVSADASSSRESTEFRTDRQSAGGTLTTPDLLSSGLDGQSVLLALDGSAGALSGALVALALAAARGARVHVLHVIDSRGVPFPPALDVALAIGDPDRDLTSHEKEVQEMRASLEAIAGHTIDWPIHVTIGTPSIVIAEEARRLGAALVIVGLHKYGRVDRALNNETALNVMRRSDCPVLGVVPGMSRLPVRILAATDFSKVSLSAARGACAIANENASLLLAYVPPITALLGDEGERTIHDLGVHAAFALAARELGDRGIAFEHVVLQHELGVSAAATLLRHASDTNCDFISAGTARQSRLERWMTGSVSTELVRDATCSILIVPPARM